MSDDKIAVSLYGFVNDSFSSVNTQKDSGAGAFERSTLETGLVKTLLQARGRYLLEGIYYFSFSYLHQSFRVLMRCRF